MWLRVDARTFVHSNPLQNPTTPPPFFFHLSYPAIRPRFPACKLQSLSYKTRLPLHPIQSPAFLANYNPIEAFHIHHLLHSWRAWTSSLLLHNPVDDPRLHYLLYTYLSSWTPISSYIFPAGLHYIRRILHISGTLEAYERRPYQYPHHYLMIIEIEISGWLLASGSRMAANIVRMAVYPSSVFDSLAYTRLEGLCLACAFHLYISGSHDHT